MRTIPRSILVASLVCGSVASTAAFAQVQDPIQYGLGQNSTLEYGCFGPCACPVVYSGPMTGTFTFYRTSVDPLYSHYALLNIDWTYAAGDTSASVIAHARGHGTYDLGGEAAAMQRLT